MPNVPITYANIHQRIDETSHTLTYTYTFFRSVTGPLHPGSLVSWVPVCPTIQLGEWEKLLSSIPCPVTAVNVAVNVAVNAAVRGIHGHLVSTTTLISVCHMGGRWQE